MRDKYFDFEIITPFKIVYHEKVTHTHMPGIDGYFGVKAGHAPFITTLRIGEIEVDIDNERKFFATSGGTVEVLPHKTTVLVETAESATEIDESRAIFSKERAERRLAERVPGTDLERAKDAWFRAKNRLKISRKVHQS
ncbi:MAG: ATP synthase F1 subunit epsilon [Candidatus Zhuqueibacterota bacterium]